MGLIDLDAFVITLSNDNICIIIYPIDGRNVQAYTALSSLLEEADDTQGLVAFDLPQVFAIRTPKNEECSHIATQFRINQNDRHVRGRKAIDKAVKLGFDVQVNKTPELLIPDDALFETLPYEYVCGCEIRVRIDPSSHVYETMYRIGILDRICCLDQVVKRR